LVERQWGLLAGVAAAALLIATAPATPVAAESGERSLSIYNIHTKETATAVYKRNGRFVEDGLKQLNHVMRDYRRDEEARMDPELIDLLWAIHKELGSKAPIHLISGYRSRATNDMLRKTVGGQASESRHILGKAADVHFPDVPLKHIRYSALIQERGGVGYYPTSALPFVHIDTDRVRSWPRLPRQELALLFPSGATQHAAADGGPITKDDVKQARVRHVDLAQQVAQFQAVRSGLGMAAVARADAGAPSERRTARPRVAALMQPVSAPMTAPALVEPLRPVSAPQATGGLPRLVSGPAPVDRPESAHLPSLTGNAQALPPGSIQPLASALPERQVASLGPMTLPQPEAAADGGRFGWSGAWVPAPAYDDEHPEELSYRPFPVIPYLTDSPTQPLMSELVAHDVAKTMDVLDQPEPGTALHFRPTPQSPGTLWALTFTGAAVTASSRNGASVADADAAALERRPVRTSQR